MLFYTNVMFVIFKRVSLRLGIMIVFFLFGLLVIEFHQDKVQNLYYECQCCGSKTIKAEDKNKWTIRTCRCTIYSINSKDKRSKK